jgi:chromosome segregation ATPase
MAGFIGGIRVNKARAISTEMDSVQKAVTVWRELSESLHQELNDLKKEFRELKDRYDILERENKKYTQKVNDLTNFNNE